ncbi:MAG TPA: hydrogenase maturation protease [Dyella sp.]|uniref:hydrogenase maturation protease n=1 Tax=Dyella sp. TaxID=1869338 RepID=UPI002BA2E9B8|nr:hydrogenase maturation protease [Dyella sp.]HUB88990.1 hydrogenase maturation protease [Dyella sp.]
MAIIGIGSPAGDDQAGWCVAHALQRSAWLDRPSCQVSVVALDRPGTGLIRYLQGADAAVLIDAMHSGREPGTVQRVDDPALLEKDTLASSHGLGVASALQLAGALGMLPKTLVLYGIEIGDVSFDAAPSAAVSHAAVSLAATIEAEVAERWPYQSHVLAAGTRESTPYASGRET